MIFDGAEVEVGNSVFDVVFGGGVITKLSIGEDRFCVSFGANLRFYDLYGRTTFGVKTLYWHDPIIMLPHKEDRLWDTLVKISRSIAEILGRKK